MNKFKVRNGVVCADVCEEHVIVATRAAKKYCSKKSVTLINETAYLIWNLLEEGSDINTLVEFISEHYNVPSDKLYEGVEQFCIKMCDDGFLCRIEEE